VHDPPEFVVGQDGVWVLGIDGALVPTHCKGEHVPLVVHTVLLHDAETMPEKPVLQV
jgi:hypothetical protein